MTFKDAKARPARGLCYYCDRPVEKGRIRCAFHLAYDMAHSLERQRKFITQGLCSLCGKPRVGSKQRCPVCLHKEKMTVGLINRATPEKAKLRYLAKRERYLKENRCCNCGAPLIEDEIKYCFSCLSSKYG